jgi:hypothetical protein
MVGGFGVAAGTTVGAATPGPSRLERGFIGGSFAALSTPSTYQRFSTYVCLMNSRMAFSSPSLGRGVTARFHVPRHTLAALLLPPLRRPSISSSVNWDIVMPLTLCCIERCTAEHVSHTNVSKFITAYCGPFIGQSMHTLLSSCCVRARSSFLFFSSLRFVNAVLDIL